MESTIGLRRMISALYVHTSNNTLCSTMAWKLRCQRSRFKFSYKIQNIPLPHLTQWVEGIDNLDFKLEKINNIDSTYDHVQDMFINNTIFRPVELEKLGCYEPIYNYELKKLNKGGKNGEQNSNVEDNETLSFNDEHPSC